MNAEIATTTRHRLIKVVQWVLLIAALAYAFQKLQGNWSEVRDVARDIEISWGWLLLASAIVLATHASLVQSWRILLTGWDSAPGFWVSVRIWTISNFGKYLPGKIWSIGAMSVMARAEGVSGVAAASSAILGTLLNIGAGFGIVAIAGVNVISVLNPSFGTLALAGCALFVVGVIALPWILPPVVNWVTLRRGLPPVGPTCLCAQVVVRHRYQLRILDWLRACIRSVFAKRNPRNWCSFRRRIRWRWWCLHNSFTPLPIYAVTFSYQLQAA